MTVHHLVGVTAGRRPSHQDQLQVCVEVVNAPVDAVSDGGVTVGPTDDAAPPVGADAGPPPGGAHSLVGGCSASTASPVPAPVGWLLLAALGVLLFRRRRA